MLRHNRSRSINERPEPTEPGCAEGIQTGEAMPMMGTVFLQGLHLAQPPCVLGHRVAGGQHRRTAARWVAPLFAKPRAWQVLDILIGLTIWARLCHSFLFDILINVANITNMSILTNSE